MAHPLCGSGTTCSCTLNVVDSADGIVDLARTGNGQPGTEWVVTPTFDHDAFNAARQVANGLTGYLIPENVGSPDAPALALRLSGTWNVGDLAGFGGDTTTGTPIYVDDNGQLRAAPDHTAASGVLTSNWGSGFVPSQTINAITDHTASTYTFNNPTTTRTFTFFARVTTSVISTAALVGGSSWTHEVYVVWHDVARNVFFGGFASPALPKARWCRVTSGNLAGYTVGGWFAYCPFDTAAFPATTYGIPPGSSAEIEVDQRITWRAGASAGLAFNGSSSVYYFGRTQ